MPILVPLQEEAILNLFEFDACGAFLVVVSHVIDPSIKARTSGGECIETLLHFVDRNAFFGRRNRPCAAEWIEDTPFP